jgi:hypothetical protein
VITFALPVSFMETFALPTCCICSVAV